MALNCLECDHRQQGWSNRDGNRCQKCGGYADPIGWWDNLETEGNNLDKTKEQEHLTSPFYQEARNLWESVQFGQIIKGAKKYPEPLNPESWSFSDLIIHAMQENVDQAHYLTAIKKKCDQLSTEREVPVKVKKLHDDAVIPQYAKALDAGFDLVAVDDIIIQPGASAKVPTGLAFELPPGYELQVRPRSGIGAKTKLRLSNAPGTVDAGYRGEVCVLIDNIRVPAGGVGTVCLDASEKEVHVNQGVDPHCYLIKKGDRIAQGVIAVVPIAKFEVVNELNDTERGDGGFGSSGVHAI